jgi:hypothetical protein
MPTHTNDSHLQLRVALGLIGLACLGACGEPLNPPPKNIAESLAVLGVDTTKTSRQIDEANAYPGTHAPLGDVFAIRLEKEIFVGSEDLEVGGTGLNDTYRIEDMGVDDTPAVVESFTNLGATQAPPNLLAGDSEEYRPYRDWLAGDFDGDDLDEVVALARSGSLVQARLYDVDGQTNLENLQLSTSIEFGTIHCESGDLDGDGDAEIILAHSTGASFASGTSGTIVGGQESVHIDFFDWDDGASPLTPAFRRIGELTLPFGSFDFPQTGDPTEDKAPLQAPWFEFAIGNIDGDLQSEVVIAINDNRNVDQSGTDPLELQPASFLVLDDINTAFAEIARGTIGEGSEIELTRADVLLSNIDGGAELEIVFGGIDRSYAAEDDASDIATRYAIVSYDLSAGEMIETGSALALHDLGSVSTAAEGTYSFHFAHLLQGDFDGDGDPEIQINNATFFARPQSSAPGSSVAWGRTNDSGSGSPLELPTEVFQDINGTDNFTFSRSNSDFGVGDLNGDGADELLTTHYPSTAPFPGYRVFRATGINSDGNYSWNQVFAPAQTGNQFDDRSNFPSIFAVDLEGESTRIGKVPGESKVSFTEPLILAAISAPPAHAESSQNLESTVTELGDVEGPVGSFIVSVETLGVDADLFDRIRNPLRPEFLEGGFYSSSVSPLLVTGSTEDTVVYTSIGFDRYTYEVLQSNESPQFNGARLIVSIPREPAISSMELQTYNLNTTKGMAKVGASILPQEVGSPKTYRSREEFMALIDGEFDQIAPLDAAAVLGSDLVASQTFKLGAALGGDGPMQFNDDLGIRGDDGALLDGFSAGTAEDNTLQWGSTPDSTFIGRVGGFENQNDFLNKYYTWGMGARLATESSNGQTFLVIDYFVD